MTKDLLSRLADAGEGAISRLGESSRLDRVTGLVNSTRERLDDLTRRVRGLEALEQRVEELEQRLDEMSPKGKSTRSAGAKSGSGGVKATAEKKPAGKAAEADEQPTEPGADDGSSAKTGEDPPD